MIGDPRPSRTTKIITLHQRSSNTKNYPLNDISNSNNYSAKHIANSYN